MHLLLISLRSDIGGGPKHLCDLVTSLIKDQPAINITIASPLTKPFGPQFKELAHSHLLLPHRRFSFIALIKLIHYCLCHPNLVIHSHGRGAGLYAFFLSFLTNKFIHTFHGLHYPPSIFSWIKFKIDLIICMAANTIICVSRDEFQQAIHLNLTSFENKFEIIENGINYQKINDELKTSSRSWAIEKWNLPTNSVVIGTLARLNYQKGIDILLSFCHQLIIKHPGLPCYFFIAGDGEEKEKLINMAKKLELNNQIFWYGETNDPIEFLSGLNIYLSFARWEGLPLSVLEAMAVKLPCLLSDVVGHKSFVDDQNHRNNLFDLGSFEDFEEKIISLVVNQEKRNRIGQQMLTLLKNSYSLEQMVIKTYSVYCR